MELVTVVGNIAVIVTIASNFAGFTGLWLQYGYLVGDSTIIGINAIAMFLQSCYVACFYICTENKKEVFRSGSSRSLPFPLILSSCAVTSLWLCYGLLVRDTFLQIPNLIGALLSGFQLCLFAVFPSKSISSRE